MRTMWAIHDEAAEITDGGSGSVSVGWSEIADLRAVGDDRAVLSDLVRRLHPSARPGLAPLWAEVLHRFAFQIRTGDLVVAPHQRDSTINIGIVDGEYRHDADHPDRPHRRSVQWLRTGVPRGVLPPAALFEISSSVAVHQVSRNEGVFRELLAAEAADLEAYGPGAAAEAGDLVADGPDALRIERYSRDFVVHALRRDLTGEEFQEFAADVLRVLGYHARVVRTLDDDAPSVVAHHDALGLDGPTLKVRCKHTTTLQGRKDVLEVVDMLRGGDVGVLMTLGGFDDEAVELERDRPDVRLLGEGDLADVVLQHYAALPLRWRELMPMRSLLVVDRSPAAP